MAYQEKPVQTLFVTKLTANDSAAQEVLGIVRELEDGRKFRYVKVTGGALALGKMVKPAAVTVITDLTSANGKGPDGATTTIITDSDATWTTDAYVGYFFKVTTGGTGSEDAIKIVGNTATTLTLEKQITTALATGGTDDGEIIPSTGVVVITAVDDLSQPCSGVGIGTITQNYFGWVQKGGPGNVYSTVALTETQPFSPGGGTTTGQAADSAAATDVVCGVTIAAGGSNNLQLVMLDIA